MADNGEIEPLNGFDLQASARNQLWRYVDFPRFISLLQHRALAAIRPDQLGDPWEGALGYKVASGKIKNLPDDASKRHVILKGIREAVEQPLRNFAVSCWHMHQGESAAMWDLYAQRGRGLAILTSVDRLVRAVNLTSHRTWAGPVEYLDYWRDDVVEGPPQSILQKRKTFKHEHEFRLVLHLAAEEADQVEANIETGGHHWFVFHFRPDLAVLGAGQMKGAHPPRGIPIPVDLDGLIEAVYVAPGHEVWVLDLVEELMKRFGLNKRALPSDMSTPPIASAVRAFLSMPQPPPDDPVKRVGEPQAKDDAKQTTAPKKKRKR
jgi:hypothetical protein